MQSTSTLREPSRFSLRAVGESWLDRIETGYSIPVFLIAFAATWTVIFSVAYWNADLHMDVLETWSVGRVFAWGFWKHPPLMGWIAHAWSCVFPLTNWSFRLLSMVNAAIALFAVDLIARRFVRGDARAVILFLLLLTPAYQFHAEKFNANSVLLAVWPLATYCFLRSFEGRTALWSIATGLLCAVAMLGKYYSIFLVIGFVGAALIHPKRSIYLRSPAPWIATASGLIALTPHLYWLVMNGFSPFHYAMESHSGRSLAHSVSSATFFVLTNLGYLIIPAVAWMTVSHVAPQKLLKAITSLNDGLFLLALVFAISICLPVIVVLAIHSDLPPAWHLQGLFFAILIPVCALGESVDRNQSFKLLTLTVGLWAAALLAAPLHALYRNYEPITRGRSFYRQASTILTDEWHKAYGMPLVRISGEDGLAFAAAFYSPDHPYYSRPFKHQYEWRLPRRSTLQKGWSALCFAEDPVCTGWMTHVQNLEPSAVRWNFTVETHLFGLRGASNVVTAMMVPPVDDFGPKRSLIPPDEEIDEFSSQSRFHPISYFQRQ